MRVWFLMLYALWLSACATSPVEQGHALIAEGRVEEGLSVLEEAATTQPRDANAYNQWIMQRDNFVRAYIRDGDMQRGIGQLDAAEANYAKALRLNPDAALAVAGMEAVARMRAHQAQMAEAEAALRAGRLERAERLARTVLEQNPENRSARAILQQIAEQRAEVAVTPPQLSAALRQPITLEFRDAPLRSVFEVISRTSGINFVFDRDVRSDLRATIFVRDASLEDIVRLLLITNQLDRKVINQNSILIFPNTPAKQKDYQDLVVRSFYLTNADAKQTAAMIRALVKTRDLYIDDKLNLVVMKDTRDAVRLAEELVATQDLGDPEVMLELEVLEVASSRLQEFGLRYPDQISLGVLDGAPGPGGTTRLPDFIELRPGDWDYFIINPAVVLNLRQTDGIVNTLANPRIRVRNREKARVHIGEKVPVITTTSTANVGVSSSVNYLEVGLKLDVEPNVYLDDEVAIKLQLEVSNILEQLNVSGTISYRLGTRNASTTLRLRDGETQVLAGLINDEDRRSANKVPYLGDFPVLGRLFRSDNDQRVKTEIVLLITPRVVRNLARPHAVRSIIPSGTESAPGSAPLRISATAPGSMEVAATGARTVARAPAVPTARATTTAPPADSGIALVVSGPSEVPTGSNFALNFGLPARNEGSQLTLRLAYDPGALQLVSGASSERPGSATFQLHGPAVVGSPMNVVQTQFRVVAKEATNTHISIESVSAVDAEGQPISITVPASYAVAIRQGAEPPPAIPDETPGATEGATPPGEPPGGGNDGSP